jgi:hypothetical protein
MEETMTVMDLVTPAPAVEATATETTIPQTATAPATRHPEATADQTPTTHLTATAPVTRLREATEAPTQLEARRRAPATETMIHPTPTAQVTRPQADTVETLLPPQVDTEAPTMTPPPIHTTHPETLKTKSPATATLATPPQTPTAHPTRLPADMVETPLLPQVDTDKDKMIRLTAMDQATRAAVEARTILPLAS